MYVIHDFSKKDWWSQMPVGCATLLLEITIIDSLLARLLQFHQKTILGVLFANPRCNEALCSAILYKA